MILALITHLGGLLRGSGAKTLDFQDSPWPEASGKPQRASSESPSSGF